MLKPAHFPPKYPVALEKCFWKSAKLDDTRKSRTNVFFTELLPFFIKLVFPTKSYLLQKVSQNLHSLCVKELLSPKLVSGCSQTRWYEKLQAINFISLFFCLFFKTLCLQQSLTCYKNYLKLAKQLLEFSSEPSKMLLERSVMLENTGNYRQKQFLP